MVVDPEAKAQGSVRELLTTASPVGAKVMRVVTTHEVLSGTTGDVEPESAPAADVNTSPNMAQTTASDALKSIVSRSFTFTFSFLFRHSKGE